MFYVYIVQCSDGSYYTGWTPDIARRLDRHNKGIGAKYTASRRPVRLVYAEVAADRSAALRREYAIKQYSRGEKRTLIAQARHLAQEARTRPCVVVGDSTGTLNVPTLITSEEDLVRVFGSPHKVDPELDRLLRAAFELDAPPE